MDDKQCLPLIESLWREHLSAPFPKGAAGLEVAGICVTLLDSFTAGCIQTFLESDGALDRERVGILDSCRRDLTAVVPQLKGYAKEYFARLEILADMVLKCA